MKKEKQARRESSGGTVKNPEQNPGAGAAKPQSPFHAFQAKSLSIVERIRWAKRMAPSKKQRAFLELLEVDVADLVLKALKVTETPTWRVNPRDLHPSSMDKFLLDGVAGMDWGDCESLMAICDAWEMELSHDPISADKIFTILVMPFLGELSDEEKSALARVYGRWADLLSDEKDRRFKLENAGRPVKQVESAVPATPAMPEKPPAAPAPVTAPEQTRNITEASSLIELEDAIAKAAGLLYLMGRELEFEIEHSGLKGAGDIAAGIQGQYLETGRELRRCFTRFVEETMQGRKGGSR